MSSIVNYPTRALSARAETSSACVSVTPDKNGYVPPGSCGALYQYYPSFAAAGAFTAIFLIVTLAHIFLAFRHKKGFCFVAIMGASWEFVSFAMRTLGTKKQHNKSLATYSFLLFILAPIWINAFVYMVAGRLIFMLHPQKRVFKVKAISIGRIFVICDILAFLVQLGGGLMISPGASETRVQLGLHIYQAGLGIQEAFVLIFLSIIIGFHTSMRSLEKSGWRDSHGRKWTLMVWVLYFVLLLITLRISYRLAEYIVPYHNNPMLDHELYMYVLDAVPMMIALLLLVIVHPGRVLVGPGSNYKEGKKEYKAQQKAAKKLGKKGLSDEEASLVGVQLHQYQGGYQGGMGGGSYAQLPGQEHGMIGGQAPLYDPHHGQM